MESVVWQFFNKTDDESIVLCKLCKPPKDGEIKTSKNTRNMWSHLGHHHKEEHKKIKPEKYEKKTFYNSYQI
jgi:hypothetical protein